MVVNRNHRYPTQSELAGDQVTPNGPAPAKFSTAKGLWPIFAARYSRIYKALFLPLTDTHCAAVNILGSSAALATRKTSLESHASQLHDGIEGFEPSLSGRAVR
jgi:hypothetical protein